jgi:hypothetical protein
MATSVMCAFNIVCCNTAVVLRSSLAYRKTLQDYCDRILMFRGAVWLGVRPKFDQCPAENAGEKGGASVRECDTNFEFLPPGQESIQPGVLIS